MADYTVKHLDEMETTFGGGLRKVRAALGVRSLGIAVEEFPPGFDRYPEHTHDHDGQEEIYIVLGGAGTMTVEGEAFAIDPATMVRVGPSAKRTVAAGPEGLRLLILGGVPGAPYEAPEWSELGAPDPMAG